MGARRGRSWEGAVRGGHLEVDQIVLHGTEAVPGATGSLTDGRACKGAGENHPSQATWLPSDPALSLALIITPIPVLDPDLPPTESLPRPPLQPSHLPQPPPCLSPPPLSQACLRPPVFQWLITNCMLLLARTCFFDLRDWRAHACNTIQGCWHYKHGMLKWPLLTLNGRF